MDNQDKNYSSENRISFRIVGMYILLGGLWITLSDWFVSSLSTDPEVLARISAFKGLAFIMFTASLLYVFIRKDIKRLKTVLNRLKWTEEKFNNLSDNIDMILWFIDPRNMNIIYLNRGFEKMTGLKKEDFYGPLDKWRSLIYPDDRKEAELEFDKWIRDGAGMPWNFEYRIIDADGNIKWVSNAAAGIFDDHGKLVSISGIIKDTTEVMFKSEELRKSAKQLREYAAHIQSVREDERLHIARELHDEIGQCLTGIKMDLTHLSLKAKKNGFDADVLQEHIKAATTNIDSAVNMVRKLSSELRPSILDDLGLFPAIEWQLTDMSKKMSLQYECDIKIDEKNIPDKAKTQVFRIFQESLTNIVRHSGATKVSLKVGEKNGFVTLEITDNGRGIRQDEINAPHSLGILGMKERAALFNGKVGIDSKPGEGAKVTLYIPKA
ncbi:MAG TPA: PAS domain-containing protein [Ignavibacteriales bacterium]|nr:PAS domain-containing protein [Ignavibacteriales bacterium]